MMDSELSLALGNVNRAASILFEADPTVRSVGVGLDQSKSTYVAVRNAKAIVPLNAPIRKDGIPSQIDGIPVQFVTSEQDPQSLIHVPHSGPGSPGVSSMVSEQQTHRPLVCGLQLQNCDDDTRTNVLANGYMIVGTLGCFVKQLADNKIAMLSNNHVLAGENRGVIGDRILQSGSNQFNAIMLAGELAQYAQLDSSPPGASIIAGNVILNKVDAAVAAISNTSYLQAYLPPRSAPSPKGIAKAARNDLVHKVGRTTGLTFGKVTQIGAILGPVPYAPGQCWFEDTLVIEGLNGATFSDHGDSGSAIVRDDGMLVGLLYAGNGTQTYACSIDNVFNALGCTLV
jgi:hypothetical protein